MFRLLGLLGGLAAFTDLGTGSAPDQSLRRCVVATRLARAAGCDDDTVRQVVYVSLLQHVGCTAYSHELADALGDDIAATSLAFRVDAKDPRAFLRTWVPGMVAATGRSPGRVIASTLRSMSRINAAGPVATCEVACAAARRLGLPEPMVEGIAGIMTMWNGKGYPRRAADDIPLATRVMHVASAAVLFRSYASDDVAIAEVRRHARRELDPDLVDVFVTRAGEMFGDMFGDMDTTDAYEAALACEPDPVRLVDAPELEAVAGTFGDLVDLKSPWFHGHSAAVAATAAAAGAGLGLDVDALRVAGHLHDIGRVAVSSRIWDKSGPLSATERDQARLHAYHGERILARVPDLSSVAPLVGRHHERCDGSGYHRGLTSSAMSMADRVLAAADAYRELVEDRPGAGCVPVADAARMLRDEARRSRLDGDAVEAVLGAAGHRRRVRTSRPAGLTGRQVDVVRLLATGMSNRAIADRLVISPRTAEHHVQDVYTKIGVSSRAAAAMFAMEHGLLDERG